MTGRAIPQAIRQECVRLRVQQNLSTPKIARAVGICNQSVYAMLSQYPWKASSGDRRHAWPVSANQRLVQLYPHATWEQLRDAFPERTMDAIQKQANIIGLRRDPLLRVRIKRSVNPVCMALRRAREIQGLTRRQLSDKLGFHWSQITNWELGVGYPNIAQLTDWAAALDFKVALQARGMATATFDRPSQSPRAAVSNAASPKERPRRCLGCGVQFGSHSAGNRLCGSCLDKGGSEGYAA